MTDVYLALGSNLGDRAGYLSEALRRLNPVCVSSFHETAPEGYLDQGPFLNAAALVSTTLAPMEFLHGLQAIEYALGRERLIPNGPRTIDLDILFWAQAIIDTSALTVPHPRLHVRRFVLAPLAEIAPDTLHPETGQRLAEIAAHFAGSQLKNLGPLLDEPGRAAQ